MGQFFVDYVYIWVPYRTLEKLNKTFIKNLLQTFSLNFSSYYLVLVLVLALDIDPENVELWSRSGINHSGPGKHHSGPGTHHSGPGTLMDDLNSLEMVPFCRYWCTLQYGTGCAWFYFYGCRTVICGTLCWVVCLRLYWIGYLSTYWNSDLPVFCIFPIW